DCLLLPVPSTIVRILSTTGLRSTIIYYQLIFNRKSIEKSWTPSDRPAPELVRPRTFLESGRGEFPAGVSRNTLHVLISFALLPCDFSYSPTGAVSIYSRTALYWKPQEGARPWQCQTTSNNRQKSWAGRFFPACKQSHHRCSILPGGTRKFSTGACATKPSKSRCFVLSTCCRCSKPAIRSHAICKNISLTTRRFFPSPCSGAWMWPPRVRLPHAPLPSLCDATPPAWPSVSSPDQRRAKL